MRRALAAMAAVLFVVGCEPAIPAGDARVSGGVMPCAGLQQPGPVVYAAANVTVFEGRVNWHAGPPGGPDLIDEMPSKVVATRTVGEGEKYSFVLQPGDYVIQAVYVPVNADGAKPYVSTTLHAGDDVDLDVPNMCL